jgi:hypothetical protein
MLHLFLIVFHFPRADQIIRIHIYCFFLRIEENPDFYTARANADNDCRDLGHSPAGQKGTSWGAQVISMLLASPLTRGLIHRAIIDSGAPMQATRPYFRRGQLEQIGVVTAQVLKAPPTGTIRYLRGHGDNDS